MIWFAIYNVNPKAGGRCTSSSVTVISPQERGKVLVSSCHLSTNVANRPGSRKEYPVYDSPINHVAFSAGSHQSAFHCSCLKQATLPELLTGVIKSRSCKINKKEYNHHHLQLIKYTSSYKILKKKRLNHIEIIK
jgi:hypothetical protein